MRPRKCRSTASVIGRRPPTPCPSRTKRSSLSFDAPRVWMNMLVAYDDRLTEHLAGVNHPERPDRVRVVARELERRGMLGERIDCDVARPDELACAHTRAYIHLVERECLWLDATAAAELSTGDTVIDAGSYEAAARAAGGTLAALDRVCAERRGAFALVRPPGHHAEPARGMGFCLFNNAALGADTVECREGSARSAC